MTTKQATSTDAQAVFEASDTGEIVAGLSLVARERALWLNQLADEADAQGDAMPFARILELARALDMRLNIMPLKS